MASEVTQNDKNIIEFEPINKSKMPDSLIHHLKDLISNVSKLDLNSCLNTFVNNPGLKSPEIATGLS